MFEAQYLLSDNSVFSPWMSRNADNLIITVDLIANSGSGLSIEVYHKNSEDTGDGFAYPNVDSSTSNPSEKLTVTTLGPDSNGNFKGMLELVRFRITGTGTGANDRVLFRMLSNVWYDDVNAATGS